MTADLKLRQNPDKCYIIPAFNYYLLHRGDET